ncbi:MAG TPA: hypothetical protein PKV76_06130 [Chitinophagales bacterium]|nr:hypothetical protein [Chitinophagales bacterium]
MKHQFALILCCLSLLIPFSATKAQDVDGVWTGNFIQYIHNSYDVEMTVEKLPPGNIFSARLRITNGFYFGEYNISGFICNKKHLEITTIVLLKENEQGSWIDCLNGTFDLNDDETELTFGDTWLSTKEKNNACKVKYIQKDMFQCLRSAYLHKAKYRTEIAAFEKVWNEGVKKPSVDPVAQTTPIKPAIKDSIKPTIPVAEAPMANNINIASTPPVQEPVKPKENKTETKIVAKNEDRAPVIDTFEQVKLRPVYVKDEIEVSSADITIEYWDRYNEDGDSINLYLNKKPILQNVLLTKTKKVLSVHLDKVKNYLVLDAINLGKEPPNTASITVKDGKKIQNVSLTSTMKTSGALKITLKK